MHFALRVVPFSNMVTTHSSGSLTSLSSDCCFRSSVGHSFKNGWTHTFCPYRSKWFVKYTFYFYFVLLRKDKLLKHQHGMLAAQCHENTNKKTSTYQCLQNQPWNSFQFIPKIGLSKCHPVAKNSKGEQLRNMKCLL